MVPTHVVCPECGFYMGRVIDPPKEQEVEAIEK
jgi:hypothetical protein